MKGVFRPHYRDYKLNEAVSCNPKDASYKVSCSRKIDDSEGMCGSESDYDSCWGRICSSERGNVLRDVLRGLLVLIALAIVITVVFLLCFFLLNDIEQKEEELVDTLIKDFSTGNRVDAEPEFSIRDDNKVGSDFPYDIDTRPNLKKSSLNERTRPPQLIETEEDRFLHENIPNLKTDSDHQAEDDLFLSFVDSEVAKGSPSDSQIANTEGSFVGAFGPNSHADEQEFDVISDFTESESEGHCVALRLPLCSGSMPWTITAFPNFVNNTNSVELQDSATYFQSVIVGSRCSTRATEYSCAILEPPCGPDGIPLPPCRTFCEDILKSCSDFLITGNRHNSAFICEHFPDSVNPNVCVDISRTSPGDSETGSLDKVEGLAGNPNSDKENKDLLQPVERTDDSTPGSDSVANEVLAAGFPLGNLDEAQEDPTLTDPPVFICDHSKFLCDDGSDCLGEESICDGIQDCLDNSDELNCTQPESTPVSFDFPFTSDFSNQDIIVMTTTLVPTLKNEEKKSKFIPTTRHKNTEEKMASLNRRTSLSDMLLSSSLVAVPILPVKIEPSEETLRNKRPKVFNSIEKPHRNAFPSTRVSPFTEQPQLEKEKRPKLSLASLLSSTTGTRAKFEQPLPEFEEQIPLQSQRSLSSLLSSSIPSFSSPRRRKSFGSACYGIRCRGDGECVSHDRVHDGVLDCVDGTDERSFLR